MHLIGDQIFFCCVIIKQKSKAGTKLNAWNLLLDDKASHYKPIDLTINILSFVILQKLHAWTVHIPRKHYRPLNL